MNAKIILFPTDFSPISETALEFASSLAAESNATLLIVHVEEPVIAYGMNEICGGVLEPECEPLERVLAEIRPTDPSVKYEHRVIVGAPAEAIINVAKQAGADLIVMATHGRSGLGHLVMGSVTEQVMRRAHCPVLVCKADLTTLTPST